MTNAWVQQLDQTKVSAWIANNGERAMTFYGVDDPHFALWMHYLNKAVTRRVGISMMLMEDWDYASAYESDVHPTEAALDLIDDLGYDDCYGRDEHSED